MNGPPPSTAQNRLLVKLRPSLSLKAAESRANLRPLYDTPRAKAAMLGFGAQPQWFLADVAEGAASPWDLAHSQVAGMLGVAEADVVFAEPDLAHRIYPGPPPEIPAESFAVGKDCTRFPQDDSHGKVAVPGVFAWHLGEAYSQLGIARDQVTFTDRPTRIAHIDTGYSRSHGTRPANILTELERNFVDGDQDPGSAEDPDNWRLLLDNSGHGTGTLSILAGGEVPGHGGLRLGGAPEAAIVPLRIADSVVLFYSSAFARALEYAAANGCDVVSMSMGGLPSRTWREAVDRAYLAGVCIVAAAGNNVQGVPTRHLVYPARYSRVIAVCGAMANHDPYAGLDGFTLEGNYGPESRMTSALAAYTPNIPWAVFGCDDTVRDNGEGTSAATPQVAAAAALWIERHKHLLRPDWQRVEAVRHALFSSARPIGGQAGRMGHGILRARDALKVKPLFGLPQSPSDKDSFAFLRVITGLGITDSPPREQMYNLEITQRWMLREDLQKIVADPEVTTQVATRDLTRFMDALIEDPETSRALKRHLAARYPLIAGRPAPAAAEPGRPPEGAFGSRPQPLPGVPPFRRLRVYAMDPSLATRLETAGINEAVVQIRWESLKAGPSGEYFKIVDTDDSGRTYAPVDLDDVRLVARDGWAPSEGNPQFHQQMVYAVAMKTVEYFEHALGRPVLWRPRANPLDPFDDSGFIQQLTVRPHALHQANAYYSPDKVELRFGYFDTEGADAQDQVPGSRIYTCLSHDIVAHETTHAVLDGMHRCFNEPTNPDVLALHEAFADIVALMQHFTLPGILESEIHRTRGDLEAESMLGSLAIQLGRATGGRGALRNAIGRIDNGGWQRHRPDPTELRRRLAPHSRGAILVAAVFDAFLAIYKERTADLLRISTGGSGVLPAGAIHPDLARRLADEAVKSARHVLTICIRALDYLPPVDVTFFEYLRALITADADLVADDRHNYRVAFVEAFRRRGIYPLNLEMPTEDTPRTLSVETLRWQDFRLPAIAGQTKLLVSTYKNIVKDLQKFSEACFYVKSREDLFKRTRRHRLRLHAQLKDVFGAVPTFAAELGLAPQARTFEVHELRRVMRVGPDGKHIPQVVVGLTQSREIPADPENGTPAHTFRGGSTLIVDLAASQIKYRIVKNVASKSRQARTAAFMRDTTADPLQTLFLGGESGEPFAALHALAE